MDRKAAGIITPAWLAWTATGADDPGFQRQLFLRLFQIRVGALALYLIGLLTAPMTTVPAWSVLLVVVSLAWQAGVYVVMRHRSPALGGVLWLGGDGVVMLGGALIGQNPVPLTLLLATAVAGGGAVQFKLAGGLAGWAIVTVPYLLVVAPVVRPDPAQAVTYSLFALLVGVGLAVATSLVDSERRAAVALRRQADGVQRDLQAVLDASRDPMLAVGPGGTIVFASRAAVEAFGEAATARGRSVTGLPGVTLGPTGEDERRAASHAIPGGERREYLVVASPMDGGEVPDGATTLWTFRDVTNERQQARERMEFVSLVTHELRAPLTTVRTVVDLMLDPDAQGLTPERREQMLRTLQANAVRWEALVTNLLTVSRIESETFRIQPRVLDLVDAARAAEERFRLDADVRDHALVLDVPPDPVLVSADPQWLDVIVNNLVSNALKYSPAGTRVTIGVVDGPVPFLAVRDEGLGISPEDQQHLFTRFFRVNSEATRDVPGTGLGLAICQQLARLHGGRISVDSAPGRGSTFRLELPAAHEDDGEAGQGVS